MKFELILFCMFLFVPGASGQYALQPEFPNLPAFSLPTELQTVGDSSNRKIVLEQRGRLWIFDNSAAVSTRRLFFDGRKVVSQNGCEDGLLGFAFHPDYIHNHFVYMSYDTGSDPQWYSNIVRYQVSTTDPDSVIPSSAFTILSFAQPNGLCNHKGGCLRFGPDGYLYASFGDGGAGGDPFGNGQNRAVFFGKILRLDVDHQANDNNYAIPSDNPFANNTQGFKKEIYSYGMRNTWRFSFDKATGKLWAGDVGQDAYEEIDIITNGGNYGWNVMEGFHCYPNRDFNCDSTGMTPPIWEYPHNGNSLAITGGFVYHGSSLPLLIGKYIYGDEVIGKVWALTYDGSSPATNQMLIDQASPTLNISSFAEDRTGEIEALGINDGKIYRLVSSDVVKSIFSRAEFTLSADRTFLDEIHLTTDIHFTLLQSEHITITLVNVAGQEIRRDIDQNMQSGEHSFTLSVKSLANGIYFVRLTSSLGALLQKIVVMK